jgi:hypothetical protein
VATATEAIEEPREELGEFRRAHDLVVGDAVHLDGLLGDRPLGIDEEAFAEAHLAAVEAHDAHFDHAIDRGIAPRRLEVDHGEGDVDPARARIERGGEPGDVAQRLGEPVGDAGVVAAGGETAAEVRVRESHAAGR